MRQDCPLPPGSKVWLYCRASPGDTQVRSVPQQIAEGKSYCQQHNLIVGHIFTDDARRGSTIVGREDFQAMLAAAAQKPRPVDAIIFWAFDRPFRNVNDAQYRLGYLRGMGYKVFSLTEPMPEGPWGVLIETAKHISNEEYLEKLSREVKRGHRDLIKAGYAPGGSPPVGFKAEKHMIKKRRSGEPHFVSKWVPDTEKWDLAHKAWKMRVVEGATLKEVHKATQLLGTIDSYRTFFKNRIYIGELEWGGDIYPNFVEPLIPREWFERERKRREEWSKNRGGGRPRRERSPYLLSGLAFCAYCNGPMSGSASHVPRSNGGPPYKWRHYICAKMKREGWDLCEGKSIKADMVEKKVLDIVLNEILTPDRLLELTEMVNKERSTDQSTVTSEICLKERYLVEITRDIDALLDLVQMVGASKSAAERLQKYEAEKAQLESELELLTSRQAQQRIEVSESAVCLVLQEVHTILTSDNVSAARNVLKSFVDKIILGRNGGELFYHLPLSLITSNQGLVPWEQTPIARVAFPYT